MTQLLIASIVWFGSWLAPSGPVAPSNFLSQPDKELFTAQASQAPTFLSELERNWQAQRLLAASA